MTSCSQAVTPAMLRRHRPGFDAEATELMEGWARWSVAQVSEALKVSPALASEFLKMAYEFPNKNVGERALWAFTGVVFRALDVNSLGAQEQERICKCVDVISSAYGWLRGDDIVKAYRLDYARRVAPAGETMAAFWKPRVTGHLLESMHAAGETELLDLLPGDAAKCVDWKIVGRRAKVVKVDFRAMADGGKLTTPHSTLLKTLRGRLLRDIVMQDIRSIADLMHYESDRMCVSGESDPSEGLITILTA